MIIYVGWVWCYSWYMFMFGVRPWGHWLVLRDCSLGVTEWFPYMWEYPLKSFSQSCTCFLFNVHAPALTQRDVARHRDPRRAVDMWFTQCLLLLATHSAPLCFQDGRVKLPSIRLRIQRSWMARIPWLNYPLQNENAKLLARRWEKINFSYTMLPHTVQRDAF